MDSSDREATETTARKLLDMLPGVSREDSLAIPGITPEDVRAAMDYPDAAAEMERLVAADRASVPAGDPAPDFRLARLYGADAGERVTLSDHFGKRPVALVFGSYT